MSGCSAVLEKLRLFFRCKCCADITIENEQQQEVIQIGTLVLDMHRSPYRRPPREIMPGPDGQFYLPPVGDINGLKKSPSAHF